MDHSRPAWPARRIVFWLAALYLVCLWQLPLLEHAAAPQLPSPGMGLLLPDFFQEWASARNYLRGSPVYTPQDVTAERYLGVRPNSTAPNFIRFNAHPPASVLLGLPFAWLDFQAAFAVWNALSLLFLEVSLWLIVRRLDPPLSAWTLLPATALLLLTYPFCNQMIHGQLNCLLLVLVTGCWAAARSGRPILAGSLLGVATAVKLFPGFLLLYFVFRRAWKAVVAAVIAALILLLVTALLFGPETYRSYLQDVLPQTSLYRGAWLNMSLVGLWHKLFDPAKPLPGFVISPVCYSPRLALAGSAFSAVCVAAALAAIVPRSRSQKGSDLAFGLTLVAMLLVSPVTWDHYLLLLLLPVALFWQEASPSESLKVTLCSLLVPLAVKPEVTVNHLMVVAGAGRAPGGGWLATPWETLTALSVHCYALLGLFVIGALVLRLAEARCAGGAQVPGRAPHATVSDNTS